MPRDKDAIAAGPLQHVIELLVERPGIRPLVAEADVAEADGIPHPPQAGRIKDVHRLGAEPMLEVVGHRLYDRVGDDWHRGGACQFRPEPGLRLEVGAGQLEQAGPRGQAKIITAGPSAAESISTRIVRGTKGTVPGIAGT